MRISTSQIFDSGARGISRNQYDLFKLQNQLSTGRRVLTPEDDPIGAAQALVLSQSSGVNDQFLKNQEDGKGKLGLVENQVAAVGDLLQNVRERLVQAGSTTLTNQDRSYIAKELEARFSELMGIANAQDGAGNYLFSGYNGAVKPYSVTASGAQYIGDDGAQLLQVSASRQIPTSVSGTDLFERIRGGNGSFVTATSGNGASINQGTGVIDQGSITNQSLWNSALNAGSGDVTIGFSVSATGVTQYQLLDTSLGTAIGPLTDFVSGQAIPLGDTLALPTVDFGASVTITGTPSAGDTFKVSPSSDQNIFTTLRNVINTLTQGVGTAASGFSTTEYVNDLAGSLQNIDQSLENVTQVRATIGSHLKEIDSLNSTGQDMSLQYQSSLSALQDLDYTKAITEMSQKQVQLQAAQLSFKQTSQLSLFSIL